MPRDYLAQYMRSPSFRSKERMLKKKPYAKLEVKIQDFFNKLKRISLHKK